MQALGYVGVGYRNDGAVEAHHRDGEPHGNEDPGSIAPDPPSVATCVAAVSLVPAWPDLLGALWGSYDVHGSSLACSAKWQPMPSDIVCHRHCSEEVRCSCAIGGRAHG